MKKTKEKLTVNSVRCLNMQSRDYMLLHKRMYVLFEGDFCILYLRSNRDVCVVIPFDVAESFLNYELSFIDLVDLYCMLSVASAMRIDSSFVLPF